MAFSLRILVIVIFVVADFTVGRRIQRSPKYPFTQPLETSQGLRFRFGVVADLDSWSRVKTAKDEWISQLITGTLYLNHNTADLKDANITIEWEEDSPEILKGGLAYMGRGQELSELLFFDNNLITMDDRTGIVYRLVPTADKKSGKEWNQVPWVILAGGDGMQSNGFKSEWATVKDGNLWIGSHGTREDLRFVKEITPKGEVTHHNWTLQYDKMAAALNVSEEGYVVHEACNWNPLTKKWVFIPRKVSKDKFSDKEDEMKASNKILIVDPDFNHIELHGMAGELFPTRGISSFKYLPLEGTNNSYIVALKAEEVNNGKDQATYILAFDTDGKVLFPETKIEDRKYEGIEFL